MMPAHSSGVPSDQQAPRSTPPNPAACLPPAVASGVSRLTTAARMNIVNTLTKGFAQYEKDIKAHLLETLGNCKDGGGGTTAEHGKCVEEADRLTRELEEKTRRIAELEEELRNATSTAPTAATTPKRGRSASSKMLSSSPARPRAGPEKIITPVAAVAGSVAESPRSMKAAHDALKREFEKLDAEHSDVRKRKRKQITDLQKKLERREQSLETYKRKHEHERRKRLTCENKYEELNKTQGTVKYCVQRVQDRLNRQWGDWADHYKNIQTRSFGLIDAVRDGDLQDLELNSLEELLKKPPPPVPCSGEVSRILTRMEGIEAIASSGKEALAENDDGKDTAQLPAENAAEGNLPENLPLGTAGGYHEPASYLSAPEDENMAEVYDSDPDRTTDDESEPEADRFSPIARAMARGPGPETLQAFFPQLPPSSPILERPATRSRPKDKPEGNELHAAPAFAPAVAPAPVPDPMPIKLESDSSDQNDTHTKLGYYQFSRENGDTLDVDEHEALLDIVEPVVPSSPSLARNPARLQGEQRVDDDGFDAANEQENEAPAGAIASATSKNTTSKKLKSRYFGEPIVNSVRSNSTQIKKEVVDEPDMITPRQLRTRACPNTAPQPRVSAPKETPASPKRKRKARAQTTVKKKRKVVRSADIEAVAEDGTHEKSQGGGKSEKGKNGQLARLLQTPEASQGIILTPPSLLKQNPAPEDAIASEENPHRVVSSDDQPSADGGRSEPSTPRKINKKKSRALDIPSDAVSPSRFRINQVKNKGVSFAFHETARTKESRQCLPGCGKECCNGFANGNMLEMWPIPEPVNKPLIFRSSPKKPKPDAKKFAKAAAATSSKKKAPSAKKQSWEADVRRRETNSTYLKHKSGVHSKQPEPLGFFNPEFPTTQQQDEQREHAERLRIEKGWERQRDSRKGGIWEEK